MLLLTLSLWAPITAPVQGPPFELAEPQALAQGLVRLEGQYPGLAQRVPVGTSAAGSEIHALRIAPTPLDPSKPALLLIGGLEHERSFEANLVFELSERLLVAHAKGDARALALLDAYTIYSLPAPNPDGLARAAASPLGSHVGDGPDVDDDRDGRRGEDPWADVDGDGRILWMRVPDPDGGWTADPHDPRANVEADVLADLPHSFRLEREARDSDGDGKIAEDPAGDRLFEANFPADWPEHEPRAGGWATQDPAVRALCDFVVAHEDLVVVVALGAQDVLVSPPKAAGRGSGRVPASGPTEEDLEYLTKLGERYREATGVKQADNADGAGTFQRWAYDHRGLWTLSARPWTMPTEAPKAEEAAREDGASEPAPAEESTNGSAPGVPAVEVPAAVDAESEAGIEADAVVEANAEDAPTESQAEDEVKLPGKPSDDAGRLAWIDATGEAWRFADWTAFEHPDLGPVEIGGFTPAAMALPPRGEWEKIASGQLEFLYGLADTPARLVLEQFEATELSAGVWQLEARVRNDGWLPSSSDAARRARIQRPTRLFLRLPEGTSLIAGDPINVVPTLASGESHEERWIVRAADVTTLSADLVSTHAGSASAQATVSRGESR
ncbi:M14 family zinc carboxypeptidase [Engelhardtia mirabilis]|uniref:Zinc carboxypeptidase n=1 Tax=Engelhardtia mirabilis TaxID=2528011 RepID=A0A518BJA8_9BACT|nr:Zinc carboxypeptidase [Planctomycetes bacterium Pla133]QDV01388.1 Zinc carboxypeptidase [Planctomycetes bacterium Pla86]